MEVVSLNEIKKKFYYLVKNVVNTGFSYLMRILYFTIGFLFQI